MFDRHAVDGDHHFAGPQSGLLRRTAGCHAADQRTTRHFQPQCLGHVGRDGFEGRPHIGALETGLAALGSLHEHADRLAGMAKPTPSNPRPGS